MTEMEPDTETDLTHHREDSNKKDILNKRDYKKSSTHQVTQAVQGEIMSKVIESMTDLSIKGMTEHHGTMKTEELHGIVMTELHGIVMIELHGIVMMQLTKDMMKDLFKEMITNHGIEKMMINHTKEMMIFLTKDTMTDLTKTMIRSTEAASTNQKGMIMGSKMVEVIQRSFNSINTINLSTLLHQT